MKVTEPLPKDPAPINERFRALRIRQPIGEIYVAKMNSAQIRRISYFDVRRVLEEDRDVERYLGIQRPLVPKRVDEIKRYVTFADATFPTSVIVAIDSDYAEYDEETSELIISNTKRGEQEPDINIGSVARVIDGQHRIAGLEGAGDRQFDVLVSVFIGSDISDQAYIFATVNLEQSKVNRSLVFDLFELANTPSPYKTCHNIAVALDQTEGSPFYHRIKRLGVATPGRGTETITQATFVTALVEYISKDPKGDRDLLLRGKNLERVDGDQARRYCFRNLFIDGEDIKIGKIVEQYFLAIEKRWPGAWHYRGTGLMLNRTNGFRALMKLFGRVYNRFGAPGDFVDKSKFFGMFDKVKVDPDYFSVERFKPGTSGESDLRRFLEKEMFGD